MFSTTFADTFFILGIQRDIVIIEHRSSCSSQMLMKLKFSRRIFEKYSNIKFHKNPSSGSRVVSFGHRGERTDGRTDMTKLTVAFCNFANAPKSRGNYSIEMKIFQ
jgi:hypothetical protein